MLNPSPLRKTSDVVLRQEPPLCQGCTPLPGLVATRLSCCAPDPALQNKVTGQACPTPHVRGMLLACPPEASKAPQRSHQRLRRPLHVGGRTRGGSRTPASGTGLPEKSGVFHRRQSLAGVRKRGFVYQVGRRQFRRPEVAVVAGGGVAWRPLRGCLQGLQTWFRRRLRHHQQAWFSFHAASIG